MPSSVFGDAKSVCEYELLGGEVMMGIGVTSNLEWHYFTQQFLEKVADGKRPGMSFSDLAAAGFAEKAAKQQTTFGIRADKTPDGYYMGESYEERLSKITDQHAALAFQEAYAKKMAGSIDYISTISKVYSAGFLGATNFADAFPQYDVITHVGNADISSANWQRNDFPFWEYFQEDTSADALNNWKPAGENPPQTRGDLQKNYRSIGSGRIAILIPESLQEKMDADPAYARQIVAKLQEWKEDYDRWDNTVAASYGYNVIEHQAGKSYVFDLDENGDVRNCTVTGSGGRLTGPTEEERRQFEAEQARKRKLRVQYIEIMEESAEKKWLKEQENIRFLQNQLLTKSVLKM